MLGKGEGRRGVEHEAGREGRSGCRAAVWLLLSSPANPPQPRFLKKFILFIYFWLRWVFIAARRLSVVAESRGYSSLQCVGFSLQWLLLLQSTDSRHVGFSSCGTRASLLRGMWDLPGPGLEPVFPALAGRFLTTAPPGKSQLLSSAVGKGSGGFAHHFSTSQKSSQK